MRQKPNEDTRQSLLSEFKRERKREAPLVRALREIAQRLEGIEKRLDSGRSASVSYEYDRVRVNATAITPGSPPNATAGRPVASHAQELAKLLEIGDRKQFWATLKAQVAEIYTKKGNQSP